MASSVLQLNLQKCSKFNTGRFLSVINNKHFNEITVSLRKRTNNSTNLCHTRSLCYLTPNTSITKQINFHQKLVPLFLQFSSISAYFMVSGMASRKWIACLVRSVTFQTYVQYVVTNDTMQYSFDASNSSPRHASQIPVGDTIDTKTAPV